MSTITLKNGPLKKYILAPVSAATKKEFSRFDQSCRIHRSVGVYIGTPKVVATVDATKLLAKGKIFPKYVFFLMSNQKEDFRKGEKILFVDRFAAGVLKSNLRTLCVNYGEEAQ